MVQLTLYISITGSARSLTPFARYDVHDYKTLNTLKDVLQGVVNNTTGNTLQLLEEVGNELGFETLPGVRLILYQTLEPIIISFDIEGHMFKRYDVLPRNYASAPILSQFIPAGPDVPGAYQPFDLLLVSLYQDASGMYHVTISNADDVTVGYQSSDWNTVLQQFHQLVNTHINS